MSVDGEEGIGGRVDDGPANEAGFEPVMVDESETPGSRFGDFGSLVAGREKRKRRASGNWLFDAKVKRGEERKRTNFAAITCVFFFPISAVNLPPMRSMSFLMYSLESPV